MSLGFGVGSLLFAAGAVLTPLTSDDLIINTVYAVGAVCFTTAAAIQWRQAADHHPRPRRRDPDWTSAAVQFAGTLLFNLMTIRAVVATVHPEVVDYRQVWRPDFLGSALFLIASWLAWHPVARERRHDILRGRSRLICWANMLGSLFFGISAAGARLLPSGQISSLYWSTMGTFVGAVCFFVGAAALRPRAAERTLS